MTDKRTSTPSVRAAGALSREVHFTLDPAALDTAVQARLKRLARTIRINGFRPGHVPLKVVERQHGARLRGEAVGDLIEAAVSQALSEHALRPVANPRVEPAPDAGPGELAFVARFEVFPEIRLAPFEELTLRVPQVSIDDADIERTLTRLREQRADWRAVERPAQSGDRLQVDFVGRLDGAEFDGGKASDARIVLGASGLLPEFDRELVGATAGATRIFDVQFPADYARADLAGKPAQFEVSIKAVEEPLLPELDAAFAQQLGVAEGGVDALRTRVRESLEAEAARMVRRQRKAAVMELLLAQHEFELPHELVHAEAHQLAHRAQEGRTEEEAHAAEHAFEDAARRRVKLGLVFAEIARAAQLKPEAALVRREIELIARRFEDAERVIQWYYADPSRLREIENAVLEEQLVDWVAQRTRTETADVSFEVLSGTAGSA